MAMTAERVEGARRQGGSTFNKTWHGLPVWAWALVAGGVGYIGYRYYKSKSAATAAQTAAALSAQGAGAGAGSAAGTQASYNPASDIAAGFDALMNQLATMNPPTASTPGPTTSSPSGLTQQQLLNIGTAEIQNETAAAGGNVLQGFKNMGWTPAQVQQLSQAASAPGGATFLTENMAAQQAGLPYYNSAGQIVG